MQQTNRNYKPALTRPDVKAIAAAPVVSKSSPYMNTYDELVKRAGEKPADFIKPALGTVEYVLAHKFGWISQEEFEDDTKKAAERSERAVKTSSRYNLHEDDIKPAPQSERYYPNTSHTLRQDPNLTDLIRRVMDFILSEAYMNARDTRTIAITNNYIAKAVGCSRDTVKRATRLLSRLGYIEQLICVGERSRMNVGQEITVLAKSLPRHHKKKWPPKRTNSGGARLSQKKNIYNKILSSKLKMSRQEWSERCMKGVERAFEPYLQKILLSEPFKRELCYN